MDKKLRRAMRPEAQPFDEIKIKTVPRYKQSEMSGDGWRICAVTEFYRKGKLVVQTDASNVEYACYLLGAKHIEACDNMLGYFGGIGNICDQEGCYNIGTVKLALKKRYSREGFGENADGEYRLFCDKHKKRGDCGLEDADRNYTEIVD